MTKTDDQIREIAQEAITTLIEEYNAEGGLTRWLDDRCGDFLSREDIDRAAAVAADAKVSVTW